MGTPGDDFLNIFFKKLISNHLFEKICIKEIVTRGTQKPPLSPLKTCAIDRSRGVDVLNFFAEKYFVGQKIQLFENFAIVAIFFYQFSIIPVVTVRTYLITESSYQWSSINIYPPHSPFELTKWGWYILMVCDYSSPYDSN